MKKNFLKKLAFTMAFATAFTALSPAAGVFAAAKPSLTVGKKVTLLLGTEKEAKDRTWVDINVKNKVKGSTYKWTTSDKAIATVNSKGVVEGQKVGSAKVTLKITLPTKKTQTLTTTVNVKDNIKEVEINNAPEAAIKVGEEKDFNRTIVSTFGGNKKAHKGAITRWEVKDAEGKATENATIDTKGVFVATEVGEYKVQAVSFQSQAKYDEYLKTANEDLVTARSAAVEVNVVATLADAKQVNSTKVDAIFNGTIEDASKLEVYSVAAGDVRVKQIVKEVKLDATKKVATAELFIEFVPGTTYVVVLPGAGEDSFVAATQNIEDVASIVIDTKEAVVNTETTIEYKLLNADGVDISNANLRARVTLESSSDRAYLNGDKLTMATVGDVTNITAKFHTYEYDDTGKEIIKVQTVAPIPCVAVASVVAGGINAYTVVKADPNFAADKVVHRLAVGDTGYKLFVKAIKTDGKEVNNKDDITSFTFDSSNENILIVSTGGQLVPVAQGSVQVLVKYNNAPIGTVTITVVAKRTAVSISPSSQRVKLSNTLNEDKTVTVEVKDQLGATLGGEKVVVQKVSGVKINNVEVADPLVTADTLTGSNGKATITLNGNGINAGAYTYKVTVGSIVSTLIVEVATPSTTGTNKQSLEISTDKIDLAIKSGSVKKAITFKVYDTDAYGNPIANTTGKAAGNDYIIEVLNQKGVVATSGKFNFTATSASFDLVTVAGGKYVKVDTGNYTVRLRSYDTATKTMGTILDVKYFTVDNTQKAPTLKVKDFAVGTSNLQQAVKNAFEIKLGDDNLLDNPFTVDASSKPDANGNINDVPSVYVYSITVNEDIDGVFLQHKVNVNRLVGLR